MLGKLEAALKRAPRNALVQEMFFGNDMASHTYLR